MTLSPELGCRFLGDERCCSVGGNGRAKFASPNTHMCAKEEPQVESSRVVVGYLRDCQQVEPFGFLCRTADREVFLCCEAQVKWGRGGPTSQSHNW